MITKTCRCGTTFETSSKTRCLCRDCGRENSRKYREKNRDKLNDYQRRHRAANPKQSAERRLRHRSTLRGFVGNLCVRSKSSCAKQGYNGYDIDTDFVCGLWKQQKGKCALTGMPMLHKPGTLTSGSIDRIDNSLGYLKTNVHLVCKWVNLARGNYSVEEIKLVLEEFKST